MCLQNTGANDFSFIYIVIYFLVFFITFNISNSIQAASSTSLLRLNVNKNVEILEKLTNKPIKNNKRSYKG